MSSHLTTEEALPKFKAMLKEEDKDAWGTDSTLKRFLKARECDLEAAYKMYTNCLKWRRENNIDKILEKEPEKMKLYKKLVACKNHGFDKHGRPVYYERVGKIHYPTLNEYLTLDDLMDIHVWQMEMNAKLCSESSNKLGKDVHQSVSIVDLSGLSMSHRHGLAFIQRCAKIDEQYYPETMGKLYIVNAPRLFPFFWGICKKWVHPNTQAKIQVLSTGFEKVLRENIPAPFLASEYGGKCTCAQFDEDGKKKKKLKEKKKEYLCIPCCDLSEMKDALKYKNEAYDSMSHKSLTVRAGSVEEVKVENIDKSGSQFSWNFKTLGKNIEFSVSCIPKRPTELPDIKFESKMENEICASSFREQFKIGKEFKILDSLKVDKHKGVFRVPTECDLRFKFDNSYSW
eukprot:CAMPEP_0184487404 /NCGR_PEP_ID=MMETSP0113_2-20130426/10021_1 /TAXON_ID=91329 /ORGANISM="Norrisiella sphaerica, Strain BC52" /LENGTH=399 /DNA_ID=CAMNT_0026869709 /DNA_START=74 /DNA_END=1270 /DNA_ORIENTATION=+